MESTAHKIRKLYPEMGRAEKKIADYILENSRSITECSVTELAKICGCGDANGSALFAPLRVRRLSGA